MKVLWFKCTSDDVVGAPASKYGDWRHPLLSVETLLVILNDLSYMDEYENVYIEEVLISLSKGETVKFENGSIISHKSCMLLFENHNQEMWEIMLYDWKDLDLETKRISELSKEELQAELLKYLSEKYPGISPEHSWP